MIEHEIFDDGGGMKHKDDSSIRVRQDLNEIWI